MVGSFSAEVEKIFVCLDVTDETVESAVNFGADLIIAHHPIIFRAVKNFRTDLPLGHKLETLIKNNIAVFAAHTNLDSVEGGVNDVLAEKLGLVDVKPFDEENLLGRIGLLTEKMTLDEYEKKIQLVNLSKVGQTAYNHSLENAKRFINTPRETLNITRRKVPLKVKFTSLTRGILLLNFPSFTHWQRG